MLIQGKALFKFCPIGGALIQRGRLFEERRSFEDLRHLLCNLSFLVSLRIPGIPGIPSILVPGTNFRDYGIGIKEQTCKEVDSN